MSNFVFDIAITKLNAPNMNIDDCSKFTVVVKFYNKEIHLTDSCINVCDFQASSAIEFRAATRKVREILGACGMSIIIYNGDIVEGRAHIYFPINYIQSIEKGMSDLIHADSVDIVNHCGVVGRIAIHCRLVIKCDNQTPDNNINMQDIMFLVSNSQHCPSNCESCQDKWEPNDNDVQLDLDLGRYQNVNTDEQKYSNIFINNNNVIEALRPLKKLVEDCKNIIESINLRSQCTGSCFRSRVKNTPFIPAASRSSDSISDNLDDFCRPQPSARINIHENSQQIKPIRFCPLCLNNMSWLPKFASCPKCGVKPIPVKNEPDDKKGFSADQILNDYMGKPQIISQDMFVDPNEQLVEEDVSQQVQSRCRCSNGNKVCAHCRIRKLCSDIFTPPEVPVAQKPSEQSVKSVDSRPHLVKVFSDLRDLYNVKRAKDRSLHNHQCKVQDNKINAKSTILKQEEPLSEEYTKNSSSSNTRTDNKNRRRTTHKGCATQQALVPRRHGWGWPSTQEARKYGWKPGAILKPIKKLMDYFLYYLPAENANNILKEQLIAKRESKNLAPILQVCKKGGETRVTLRAGNGGKAEKSSIVFKIVKSDFAVTLNEVKKKLKAQGFRKCTCHNSLMMCVCRSNIEKRKLEGALQEECERRGIENCVNDLVLTDTSDSEAEFDINVTPPAKAPQTPTILKRQTVNHATQITNTHGKVPPRYPIKQSNYWRAYDCAAGGRFTGTAFGAPGEKVFEDGFFGHLGGGPHGATIGRNRFGAGAVFKSRRTARESDNIFSQLNHIPYSGAKKQRALEAASKKKIPVKLTKHIKKKLTKLAPIPVNKQIDMMDYLRKHNAFMKVKPGSLVGPDGLTAAQRKRRALLQAPPWPIEFVSRLGSGIDPYAAQCYRSYDQYSQQWCSPWSYYG